MNSVIAVNPGHLTSSVLDIPLERIRESKTNPRRTFDETKLAELAANIKLHGVLQPVLVRPLPDGEAGFYELVAGARRYRASKLAERETIPAGVRELTDTECLELQLIENLQRADVHELDEARGYAALIRMQPDTYTVETLAEKVGRSEKYVYARLRLTHLVEEVQEAFYAAKLTVAHAFEIARLQPDDQRRALTECFPQHKTTAAVLKDKKAEAVTVRSLREWIEREILLDISNAPFDAEDSTLLPAAGSCAACPKRTGNNPLLFPEIRHKSICTDRACYRAKVEALVQIRVKPLEESGEKPLRISKAPAWQSKKPQPDVLYEGQYRCIAKKAGCPHTRPAVVIDGAQAGTVMHICRDEKCPVHARETRYQPTPQERAARSKELLAERVEKLTRVRILDAVRRKLPAKLARPDLEMAALDYFRRLGHDNHRRVCRVYQWEEKKTKASWGAMAVDYEAIAGKMVRAMNPHDLGRFLIVCSLVSDLYCPGFDARQPLAKDSNLACTALRYKLDTAKLTAEVRIELTKKSEKLSKKKPKAAA
ncbi:MAG: ParB/RepB/Spo0J family partition protein [Acidobacteria bacterium]|nr:ParB/RepB/Spo0J family partition protein [Acidobacteriota bacterium]MBS1867234.1 ParB/RepB/Spo0J family partition protein [Acidobacteriota bacterium]